MYKFFAVFGACLLFNVINSMAPIPIEVGESGHLAEYHANVQRRLALGPNYQSYFMPRNQMEFSALYKESMSGKLYLQTVSKHNLNEALRIIWGEIMINIGSEICARSKDKNRFLLDKYLLDFSAFVSCVDKCEDKTFIFHLCSGEEIECLENVLFGWLIGLDQCVKGKELPQADVLYLVTKLNNIFSSTEVFKDYTLLDSYNSLLLDETFVQSPEYKTMYAEVEKMLTGGITLETK
jgi:hypothetical protein